MISVTLESCLSHSTGFFTGFFYQASLHAHFNQQDQNGFDDLSFVLIGQAFNETQLRQKECFWQYKLDVFEPEGLNVRDVQPILD